MPSLVQNVEKTKARVGRRHGGAGGAEAKGAQEGSGRRGAGLGASKAGAGQLRRVGAPAAADGRSGAFGRGGPPYPGR